MSRACLPAFAAWLCLAAPASAQTVLTLEQTVALARERAGTVAVARARIAEAEAGLLDPSARFRDNPAIEANAGPRTGDGRNTADLDVGVSQQFETGGQRRARVAGAQAAVDRQRADVAEAARRVVADAASAFLDGLAAIERVSVADAADAVSRQLLAATERRFAAGDVAAIEVNLARIEAARTAAAVRAARADREAVDGRLRALLRLSATEPIELRGTLDLPAAPAVEQLLASVEQRPEFAVLAAEGREAEAQAQLGRALARPDLGIRVGYAREAADTIVLGGLTVNFPAFQRGQGTLAAGRARTTRVDLEREIARESALLELRTAHLAYTQRSELVAALARDALPAVVDNESLAQRSYDAGEMSLMDMLLIRRDALDTRTAVIERRLDAARSRVAVDLAAGVLR
jgi:outer membrane protein, heavy metal efflux system